MKHEPNCWCDACINDRMRDIRAQIAGEVDDRIDADMVEYRVSRHTRAVLIITDVALVVLACLVIFMAGVGTVPAHAAALVCLCFWAVGYMNHRDARKNGII